MSGLTRIRRGGCGGCRGAKAIRGDDRNAAAALYDHRRTICATCQDRETCYVAHQTPCAQRRILLDPGKFCPASPPHWQAVRPGVE